MRRALALPIFLAIAVVGCGGSSSSETPRFTGDGIPGIDLASSRSAKGEIDSTNAANLEEAWSLPLREGSSTGAMESTPVVAENVIYAQDIMSDVKAVSLDTGEVLWTHPVGSLSPGPNGVVVGDGKVYGATPTNAFALDQKTGKELWSVKLTKGKSEALDMAPGYHNGKVFLSTAPRTKHSNHEGGAVGVLWALDGRTGKKLWHFTTVSRGLWGNPKVNSGGGIWYPPSFDNGGYLYAGIGNPAPVVGTKSQPWGSSRPGPNLYTDSVVKLDEKSGALKWYYQLTPHDLYDWDFQDSPILVKANGKSLAIGAGKAGVVVALDTSSGKVVWRRPVGKHNGHDSDSLLAMRNEASKIKAGVQVYPGLFGGVIAPMASNGQTLFVPIVDSPTVVSKKTHQAFYTRIERGELEALDIGTGRVLWVKSFSSPLYGSPIAMNDVVFAATFRGEIKAFDARTGGELWHETLPAGLNAGLTATGDTLIAPSGVAVESGQTPKLVAYKLGG